MLNSNYLQNACFHPLKSYIWHLLRQLVTKTLLLETSALHLFASAALSLPAAALSPWVSGAQISFLPSLLVKRSWRCSQNNECIGNKLLTVFCDRWTVLVFSLAARLLWLISSLLFGRPIPIKSQWWKAVVKTCTYNRRTLLSNDPYLHRDDGYSMEELWVLKQQRSVVWRNTWERYRLTGLNF